MDLYGLIGKIKGLTFFESFKFICKRFGLSYRSSNFTSDKVDMSFFEKFKPKDITAEINQLDKKILNSYYDFYHKSWIEDNISPKTMKKFNIKYSVIDNQIIIPHYDLKGNLIGIRARNLNQELVNSGKKYMPVFYKNRFLKHPTGSCLYGLNFNLKQIKDYGAIILCESEKSVMQIDTMFPDMSIAVSLSGSTLTDTQIELLNNLGIEQVIIALDKEFSEVGSIEEKYYIEKINSVFINKLGSRFETSVMWDVEGLLDLKDSPSDKGAEIFMKLFNNRILVA
ncbi:hypothetical protein [Bacillus sp. Bos-x628]|uniref:hypothetical protein n=1 Tax=Bacillus maqinnsis TaxID=3229854 RepID=UPI00338DD634